MSRLGGTNGMAQAIAIASLAPGGTVAVGNTPLRIRKICKSAYSTCCIECILRWQFIFTRICSISPGSALVMDEVEHYRAGSIT